MRKCVTSIFTVIAFLLLNVTNQFGGTWLSDYVPNIKFCKKSGQLLQKELTK